MHLVVLIGKFVAALLALMFISIGWRLFKVGMVPVDHGLRPDWSYLVRSTLSFALAAGITYFAFIR